MLGIAHSSETGTIFSPACGLWVSLMLNKNLKESVTSYCFSLKKKPITIIKKWSFFLSLLYEYCWLIILP